MLNNTSIHIKAVLLDLDDTLFDHLHSTRQALVAVCQAYPELQQHPIDDLFNTSVRILDEVHLHVLEGKLTIDEARLERYQRFFTLYLPKKLDISAMAEHATQLHRAEYQASRQLVAGALPLLEYLHGKVKIAVVTNNLLTEQVEKLRYLKLDHLIDELVASEETGFIKPDPRIFQVALQRLGCDAEEVVMIGDSWKADVLGARQAGIRAIWLNRTGSACPDPELAAELQSFEPLEETLGSILGGIISVETHI